MQLATISGPPSSGKTSILIHMVEACREQGKSAGVIKLDCLATDDDVLYKKRNIPVMVGLSGNLCPDHFFVANFLDCIDWGKRHSFDYLFIESAGLCNRCSPHVKGTKAVCVIDNLMGVRTPRKIGPMLKMADIIVVTKTDVVSQAEREVFAFHVRQANPKAVIMQVNGITGQGCRELAGLLIQQADIPEDYSLRFNMPAALCSYCLGETRIGREFQMGNIRRMNWDEP